MRGHLPVQYFQNPKTNDSYDVIYQNLDGFTQELFEEEAEYFNSRLLTWLMLLPLPYEGKFVKKSNFLPRKPVSLLLR